MAKKKSKTPAKKKPLVTMADLQAMSDSEGSSLPPEDEWDADAKALRDAIQGGAFDKAFAEYQAGKDDESIEEAELDDGEEGEEVDDEDAEEDEEQAASGDDDEDDDDDNGSEESEEEEEESEEEDEPDTKSKVSSKPQHKKSVPLEEEEEASDADSDDEDKEKEEEEDSDSDEDDEAKQQADMDHMNTKAMSVVTQELRAFRASMPWAESFSVVPPTPLPFAPGQESSLDIHDDLKREVAFYDMALEAALVARKKCQEAKVPFSRPEDFFAEMVKTDGTYPEHHFGFLWTN